MEKGKSAPISELGESDITITPEKVDKLEADDYLIEKTLKAQENALEELRRKKITTARLRMQRRHNEIVRRRKQERQNKRRARK